MWRYYDLLSAVTTDEIRRRKEAVAHGANPRDIKVELALELVTRFHGAPCARQAHDAFVARFRQGILPEEMPEFHFELETDGLWLPSVMKAASLVASTSEATRLIRSGGVRVNGERIEAGTMLWTAGVMGWFDLPINPANIMTLPLVVGIGVTNGIHLLNRFVEEGTVSVVSKSTGKAVMVSGLTTIAGFSSLILGKHQGIQSLGLIMSLGVGACMIAALTVLPALLALAGSSRQQRKTQ
jgi:hypothetical protein